MAENRTLWDRLFGRKKDSQPNSVTIESSGSMYSQWSTDPCASDIARGAVDAIARNAAKLKPNHIRRVNGKILPPSEGYLKRLLQVRPNPRMSTYDFLYKVISVLMYQNDSFMYPEYDAMGNLTAIWPVTCTWAEFLEDAQGVIYVRFWMKDGKNKVMPYDEVLHLRRHFIKNDMVGETNAPMKTTLEVINTTDQGMAQAVKTSANLRGLLKFNNMLKPEDLEKQRKDFLKDFLDVNKSGGVAAIDAKAEYTPLSTEPKIVNAQQMQELRDRIYRYYGVNDKIVMGKYTEDEWNAFYESVLEPIAVQLSLEFTAKLFTSREQGFGNEIIFEANRLQYASIKSKLDLVQMVDRGSLLPNEWREAFNLGPIPGGDKPLRRLDTGVVKPNGDTQDEGGDGDGGDGQEGNPNGGPQSGGSGQ